MKIMIFKKKKIFLKKKKKKKKKKNSPQPKCTTLMLVQRLSHASMPYLFCLLTKQSIHYSSFCTKLRQLEKKKINKKKINKKKKKKKKKKRKKKKKHTCWHSQSHHEAHRMCCHHVSDFFFEFHLFNCNRRHF